MQNECLFMKVNCQMYYRLIELLDEGVPLDAAKIVVNLTDKDIDDFVSGFKSALGK